MAQGSPRGYWGSRVHDGEGDMAVVIGDGTLVHAEAGLDSSIVTRLPVGTTVRVAPERAEVKYPEVEYNRTVVRRRILTPCMGWLTECRLQIGDRNTSKNYFARSLSGDLVELTGLSSVAQARGHVATMLGVNSTQVWLMQGTNDLHNHQLLEELHTDEELRAVISSTPSWYPTGKYIDGDKDVLRIIRNTSAGEVQYTDGSTEVKPLIFIDEFVNRSRFHKYSDWSNVWVPPEKSSEQDLGQLVRAVLENMSSETLDAAVRDLSGLTLETGEELELVVGIIFSTVLNAPDHCDLFADMALKLRQRYPTFTGSDTSTHVTFKRALMNALQNEFETMTLTPSSKQIALMKFIGSLCRKQMFTPRVIAWILGGLLDRFSSSCAMTPVGGFPSGFSSTRADHFVEYACELLKVAGPLLARDSKNTDILNHLFEKFGALRDTLSPAGQVAVHDLLELRAKLV